MVACLGHCLSLSLSHTLFLGFGAVSLFSIWNCSSLDLFQRTGTAYSRREKMATQQSGEENRRSPNEVAPSFVGAIEEQYKKLKEDAEAYPYVWASYTVVYGGLFLWTAYRWRKLRKTEDRVRALQEKLRKRAQEEEEAAAAAARSAQSVEKSPSADKSLPK